MHQIYVQDTLFVSYTFIMARTKAPVTLVTGYLGSGKTTFLNRVISSAAGRRVAIVVNEFGSVGIDGALLSDKDPVSGASAERVIELAGGCVCCVVGGEFRAALANLDAKQFDHVIIEMSGAADPSMVVKTFWTDALLSTRFRLDGVICLVDGPVFFQTIEQDPIAALQATVADVHLISKIENLTEHELQVLHSKLKELNPMASILEVELSAQGNLGLDRFLDLNAYGAARSTRFLSHLAEPSLAKHGTLNSFALSWQGQVSKEELQRFFRALVLNGDSALAREIVRIKALIHVKDEKRIWLIQGVRDCLDRTDAPRSYQGPNRLVILGMDFCEEKLNLAIKRLKQSSSHGNVMHRVF